MFIDASALVALIAREPEWESLDAALRASAIRLTSPIAVWEAALAVTRKAETSVDHARSLVERSLAALGVEVVPIGAEEATLALDAHARFGKGRHPARLNMGDCFAYACARRRGLPLLYKGEDFALTDIAVAA